jgi:LmbE family N-acetylglucosaminyl deacetylase
MRQPAAPIIHLLSVLAAILLLVLLAAPWHRVQQAVATRWQRFVASSAAATDPPDKVSLPKSTLAPLTPCSAGTVVVVAAHQDDDLLFMNPDIQRAISAGRCIQTVYMTTGDDGHDGTYWQSREAGSEAAYAAMFGTDDQWQDSMVTVGRHQLRGRTLVGHENQVNLIFMRFPDGGLTGEGYSSTGYESLKKLQSNAIKSIHTIDTADSYSYQEIIDVLRVFITTEKPAIIYAQQHDLRGANSDHSDHYVVGYLAWLAAAASGQRYQFNQYTSYPIGFMPPNVTDADAEAKQHIFETYAHFDATICNASGECPNESTYSNYFSRMYSTSRWP